MNIRTRFAPSPTGYLHIGGLRTALYAFLFAKKNEGTLVLRIEDTDRSRYVEGSIEALISVLGRVGILYDEGPFLEDGQIVEKGEKGPYLQSDRLPMYKKFAEQLVEAGQAYPCFCTKEELDRVRKGQELAKLPTKYNRACLKRSPDEVRARVNAKEEHVIRMKVPEGETVIQDEIRGRVVIQNSEIDDQVLMKSDGFPTYHLANVVDDHLMEISHVIRGEEWISSTPKHIILYEMFGWSLPIFAHLPLLLNPDKSKLSKRQGDVAVEDFLEKGYMPEALVNFVALLGFNPKGDQEIYSVDELVAFFDLKKVNKSGAVLNREKLDWMNEQYIHAKSGEELAVLVRPFLDEAGKVMDDAMLAKVCEVEKSRMTLLSDVVDLVDGYVNLPEYDPSILVWKKTDLEDAKKNLNELVDFLEGKAGENFDSIELLEETIKRYIEDNGLQNGNVLWPMRVALSGRERSPSPFELAWALGGEETLARLKQAQSFLKA